MSNDQDAELVIGCGCLTVVGLIFLLALIGGTFLLYSLIF